MPHDDRYERLAASLTHCGRRLAVLADVLDDLLDEWSVLNVDAGPNVPLAQVKAKLGF